MKKSTLISIAFLAAMCVGLFHARLAGGAVIPWNVQIAQADDTAILNISDAQALLAGNLPQSLNVTTQSNVLNFFLPDHTIHGQFAGDLPFPGISTANEQDFAVHATASLNILSPGSYTFGISSDDGFSMSVGGTTIQHSGQRSPAESYMTANFSHAGVYPIDVVYFQHRYNAELEVFASPGAFTSIGQPGSNFQLVGDTINGGVTLINPNSGVPEPLALLFFIPLSLGLLLRRS